MLPDPSPFLHTLFTALSAHGVDVSDLELDHVCYRVESGSRYETMKNVFARQGKLLAASMIGGRPIATYLMNEPFIFLGRSIDVVELPSPKKDSPYPEGYEHVEFVVDEDLLQFSDRYPKLAWDLSGTSKTVNADVRLSLGAISVKFHREALAKVIARELNR